MTVPKRGKGRPTLFTPALLDFIIQEISDGCTEYSIFLKPAMPCWRAWTKYKREHPDFIPIYAQAKGDCYEVWEHKMRTRAMDESRDLQPDGKGGFKSDNTAVNRDRLCIDTDKWLMSKLMSKKYGDKVQQELSGPEGGPIPGLKVIIEK